MKKISLFASRIISHFRLVGAFLVVAILFGFGAVALASHSWGGYHWARIANPFTLQLGDNVSTAWDSYLRTTSSDWSISTVLDTTVVNGQSNINCKATNGRVEVCNKKYGPNGWLGIAQIWVSGSHITQGVVKVNDTYFSAGKYNTPAWRNLVMCQEVGHTLGLNHNDEIFTNTPTGTCMDYSNDPTPNQHPNQHDYEQLVTIYGHTDTITTVGAALLSRLGFGNSNKESRNDVDFTDSKEWGKSIKKDGHGKPSLYERDLDNGKKLHTFVFWAS